VLLVAPLFAQPPRAQAAANNSAAKPARLALNKVQLVLIRASFIVFRAIALNSINV
jgi:hypothetical protein